MAALKISAPKSTSTQKRPPSSLPLHKKGIPDTSLLWRRAKQISTSSTIINQSFCQAVSSILCCLLLLSRVQSSLCQLNLIFIKGFTDENKQPSANTFASEGEVRKILGMTQFSRGEKPSKGSTPFCDWQQCFSVN